MKNSIFILSLIFLFAGCEKEKSEDSLTCLTDSETLTWNSYGYFSFGDAGFDDENFVNRFIEKCDDWSKIETPAGGYDVFYGGETTAKGIHLEYNHEGYFRSMIIGTRWKGSTAEGIQMGDTKEEFNQVYPYFELTSDSPNYPNSPQNYFYNSGEEKVIAIFSSAGTLSGFYIWKE